MWKLLLPLLFLACNSAAPTSSVAWQVKTFNLADKALCPTLETRINWKPERTPTQWEVYTITQNKKVPASIAYQDGFGVACNWIPDGIIEIYYTF